MSTPSLKQVQARRSCWMPFCIEIYTVDRYNLFCTILFQVLYNTWNLLVHIIFEIPPEKEIHRLSDSINFLKSSDCQACLPETAQYHKTCDMLQVTTTFICLQKYNKLQVYITNWKLEISKLEIEVVSKNLDPTIHCHEFAQKIPTFNE